MKGGGTIAITRTVRGSACDLGLKLKAEKTLLLVERNWLIVELLLPWTVEHLRILADIMCDMCVSVRLLSLRVSSAAQKLYVDQYGNRV